MLVSARTGFESRLKSSNTAPYFPSLYLCASYCPGKPSLSFLPIKLRSLSCPEQMAHYCEISKHRDKKEIFKCPLRGKIKNKKQVTYRKIKISMASGFSKTLVLKENGEIPANPRGKDNFILEFYT